MQKTLRDMFVNRLGQSSAFGQMLDESIPHCVMVLAAEAGMGKSWLLHVFAHEARRRNLPLVQIDFADRQPYDTLTLVCRCRDSFGSKHFDALANAINVAMTARIALMTETKSVRASAPLAPTELTVETGGGDYAGGNIDKRQGGVFIEGPIIKDSSFIIHQGNPYDHYVFEDRINTTFFECLQGLCTQNKVVFLFDTYERNYLKSDDQNSTAADRWICGQLLERIRDRRLTNVIVVLAGRQVPKFNAQWNGVLRHISLNPLKSNDVKEYLHQRCGLAIITDEHAELLHQAIAGNPQILGMVGDNLVRASGSMNADDEW